MPYSHLSAKVTGLCANCHTMHNSQNGSAVAKTGSGMGWNGSGQLTGGSGGGPQVNLLVTNCVGCHTSTTNQTIITAGGSRVPIVFNTVQPNYMSPGSSNALAGGNFYWVRKGGGDDRMGHNVYGVSDADSRLAHAPGGGHCTTYCHGTLVFSNITKPFDGTPVMDGCQGCHLYPSHHSDNGIYRFLTGMSYNSTNHNTQYVAGVEDPDWEQTNSNTKHNYYKGTLAFATIGLSGQGISEFCGGCHDDFHGYGTSSTNSSPWIRHPTDISLPQTDEYNGYDPVNSYSVEAPVAWVDPSSPARSGAIVMCLSCHRAHGSPYPSSLRWDYTAMVAGGGGSGGCFTCHTSKK
ncbi:MAG TPA: cytochrome c3 family protein [Dissulfurispiraceae bacterium]